MLMSVLSSTIGYGRGLTSRQVRETKQCIHTLAPSLGIDNNIVSYLNVSISHEDLFVNCKDTKCKQKLTLESLAQLIVNNVVRFPDPDQALKYLVAMMYVESSFNPDAISSRDAYGILQLTQDAVTDAADHCGLPRTDVHAMLLPKFGVEYGSCYVRKLYREQDGDWTRILIVYNAGYKSLTRYLEGGTLPNETAEYLFRIHSSLHKCSEEI